MNVIKKLIDDKFVLFSFLKIITEIRKNGEEKKKLIGMIQWDKINQTNYHNYLSYNDGAFAIICGKMSGITVLDFDIRSEYERLIQEHPELKMCRTINTNKGVHIYFKYTDKIKTTTDGLLSYKSVDIRNDDSIVFSPPTQYKLSNGSIVTYEDLGGELIEVPEYICNNAKCNNNVVVNKKSKTAESNKQIVLDINLKYIDDVITSGQLDYKANGTWDDWRDVGFIINHTSKTEEGRALFHKFSKINKEKYDEKYTNEWWNTIRQKTDTPLTIQTMKSWLNDGMKFVSNEKEAVDMLYDELKDILKSYKGRLFYLKNNIWLHNEQVISDALFMTIFNSNIYFKLDKDSKIQPFVQNVSKARKVQEALVSKIRHENEDTQLYDKFHNTTKAKLCFEDGVLDFKTKTFQKWTDISANTIYPVQKIPIEYSDYWMNPDMNVINSIEQDLFKPQYGEKTKEALHYLSRALAGHVEDKVWATYLGNRNCGKGVEYLLLKNAFGPYVDTFELDNICYIRKSHNNDNGECARKQYWLLDFEFVRLAVSQETPDIKSGKIGNGKILKKISGGGDEIVARRNFDRVDTHFTIDTTFYIKGNFSFCCDSDDCNETRLEFQSLVQYKTEDEINLMREQGRDENEMKRYLVADSDIKVKCSSIEWKKAVIYLIVNNYKNYAVPIAKEIDVDDNTLISTIKRHYEITLKENDVLTVKSVKSKLVDYDSEKIELELNSMNVMKKKYKKKDNPDLRDKWCYFGIKKIETNANIEYFEN